MSVKDKNNDSGKDQTDDSYNGFNFGGQSKDEALSNYDLHDTGEMVSKQLFSELGFNLKEIGYDGRDEDEELTEIPDEEVEDEADMCLVNNPNVLVEVKTTRSKRFIGNMEKTAWYKHKRQAEEDGKAVIIMCFAIDENNNNEIIEAGCYLMGNMPCTGGNPANGRYFKHCDQSKITSMENLSTVVKEALDKVNNTEQ